MKIPVALIFVGALELCTAGRILYLIPVPSKSYYILSQRLVEELAERGHEVTVIAFFKSFKRLENVNEIVVPKISDSSEGENPRPSAAEEKIQKPRIPLLYSSNSETEALVERTMTYQPVIDLLNSNLTFDLVVGNCVSMEGLLAGFAHRLNASMALISNSMASTNINEIVGNPAPSSFIPDGSLGYTDNMTFYQRLVNFLQGIYSQFTFYLFHLPQQDKLMRKHFGSDLPPLKELLLNNSLVLVNHHYGLAFPRPNLPNVIEVGGYYMRPAKPLPKELEEFMDEAKDGVIYFSMGSNLNSTEFPKEKFENILKTFSKLKQRVLWKFENENPPILPANVKISKWLPQSDILAHPNLKLFISHGGLLSLTESIFRGVPIVGIPLFQHQTWNIKQIENLEAGVQLEFDDINEETMSKVIQEVLDNPKYSQNARYRSQVLQDRPQPPLETAVYWLEYVMRYKGAPQLKSGSRNLSWYQLYSVDVLTFIGTVLIFGTFSTAKLFSKGLSVLREAKMPEISFFKKNN